MLDTFSLYCVLIGLQTLNVIFHIGGIYLLRAFTKTGKGDVQLKLVATLSFTEVVLNIAYIIFYSCNLVIFRGPVASAETLKTYIDIVSGSIVKFVYYLTMIYLAVNKLLEITFSIQYQLFCTKLRTRIILAITWVTGFLFFILVLILHIDETRDKTNKKTVNYTQVSSPINMTYANGTEKQPMHPTPFLYMTIFNYFYTALDIFFLAIAIGTHSYIFHKYRESREDPLLMRAGSVYSRTKKESLWQVFRGSRFYVSALLLLTFIFMTVLPKLLYFFFFDHISDGIIKVILSILVAFLYYFSFLADVLIYIFLYPPLTRLLWKKLRKIKWMRKFIPDQRRDETFTMSVKSTMSS